MHEGSSCPPYFVRRDARPDATAADGDAPIHTPFGHGTRHGNHVIGKVVIVMLLKGPEVRDLMPLKAQFCTQVFLKLETAMVCGHAYAQGLPDTGPGFVRVHLNAFTFFINRTRHAA